MIRFLPILLICLAGLTGCKGSASFMFEGIPEYPNSDMTDSMLLKSGYYAEFQSSDSPDLILAFYNDHMRKEGWSLRLKSRELTDGPSTESLMLFKGNRDLIIDAYKFRDRTRIAVFMGGVHE